jgi:hypothetical protein
VAWARIAAALLITLSFTATQPGPVFLAAPAYAGPLQHVGSHGVEALLPARWEYRPLPLTETHRRGIQASSNLSGWSPADLRRPGLEAFWVDATEVGVPSDYYGLAARGPALDVLNGVPGCQSETRRVAEPHRHATVMHPWPGHFVATVIGTCAADTGDTLWASVVAAPGFGPVHEVGIPESGLYVVRASVSQGPSAELRLGQLMNSVSFGGTSVPEMLVAAGLPSQLA